jgi:hypothetical protein
MNAAIKNGLTNESSYKRAFEFYDSLPQSCPLTAASNCGQVISCCL